ncbi:conjugal transfer protein [Providencia rettgeri]|nr:conjugal transfer protein [Providencia rettgeri]
MNIKPSDKENKETDFSIDDLAVGTPLDACKVAICMMGEVTGNNGGSDCRNPIKKFFSINAFKKHHRFNPSKTLDMRKAFLGECPDLTKEYQDKILSKFGRIRG